MSYEEFLQRVHEGIVTPSGNCPITPLLLMLQGYAIMNWGFAHEND